MIISSDTWTLLVRIISAPLRLCCLGVKCTFTHYALSAFSVNTAMATLIPMPSIT